ncbi:MAG: tetratricopeptide repeat protein, partial [Phycisphaeraceae bacterium]
MTLLFLAGAMILSGCGDSPEHKLLTAHHMLRTNKPGDALRLAEEVLTLELKPEHAEQMKLQAVEIKVLSLLALNQLQSCRNALDQLQKEKPDDSEPVRLMGVWAQRTMDAAVSKADFFTSIELTRQFDEALVVGEAQADLLAAKFNKPMEAELLRARLVLQDVNRYRRMVDEEKRKAERHKLLNETASQELANNAVQRVERSMATRSLQAEEHLLKVIQIQPLHQEAVLTYLNLLTVTGRGGQDLIFDLANRMAATKDVPAILAHSTAMAVLNIDRAIRSDEARADLVERVLATVPADQRTTPHWLLSSAHVMLMRANTTDALTTLEQIHGGDAMIQMQSRYLLGFALYQQKKLDRARLILDQLSTQASGSPQVLVLHGRVLLELGDTTLALEQARRALSLDSSFSPASILELDCKAKVGQTDSDDTRLQVDIGNIVANRLKISKLINAGNKGELDRHLDNMAKNILPLKDEHVAMLIEGYAYLERWDKMLFFANEYKRMRPDQLAAHLKYAEAVVAQDTKDGPARARAYIETIRNRFPEMGPTDQVMAQLLLARQDYDQAVKLIEADIARNPTSVESRLAMARVLASTERVEEAKTQLEEVLAIDPANRDAHGLLARIYLFMGDTDSAGKHISRIDETQVDAGLHPALKAQILIQKDDLQGARDVCNSAVARGNPDPVLLLLLARIYIIEKNPELAEKNLLLLATAQPGNVQVWRLLGEFYQLNPNLQAKGLNTLRKMATSNDVLTRIAMSGIYSSQGKLDEAMFVLNEIFPSLLEKKDERAFEVANAVARIHLIRKEILKARDVFKTVEDAGIRKNDARLRQIDLSWGDPSVHYTTTQLQELAKGLTPADEGMRAQVLARLAKLGKNDEAIYVIDQWIAESPKQPTLHRWKGEVLGQMGKYMDSITSFKQAITMDPTRLGLRARLVSAHLSNYDFPAAEKELRDMAKIDAKAHMLAMAELGQLFARLGLNQQAVGAFEELEKAGVVTEPTILFAMGRSLAAMSMNEKARDRLSKVPSYARLFPSSQVELARLEMRGGLNTQAKERIAGMVVDARSRARAMTELLTLNPYDRKDGSRDAQVLQWADDALQGTKDAFGIVPKNLQSQWMRVRVILMDRNAGKHDGLDARAAEEKARNDYRGLFDALVKWQELEPNSIAILKGQLAVLARIDLIPQARQIYRSIPQLATTIHGP